MPWRVLVEKRAQKELRKISRPDQVRVLKFLSMRIVTQDDPRATGEAFAGPLAGLWKYRIGDLRIVAKIEDDGELVQVLRIAHRREVYR